MSLFRLLPALIGGSFLLLGLAQAQTTREPAAPKEKPTAREQRPAQGRPTAKPQHICKLRLAWWEAPEEPPELAIQQNKDRIPVTPEAMTLGQIIDYQGEAAAVVLRKFVTTEVDKAGKPVVQWVPYCTIPVGENDTDLAVLLFHDEKRGIAQTRIFDFSVEAFPYGSVELVNFTSAKIAVSIDGTTFTTNSRGTARYPKIVDKDGASRFFIAAAEANGEQKLLRSTMMTFRPSGRFLIFVIERPGASEDARYNVTVIIDNQAARQPATETTAVAKKAKGRSDAESNGSTKAAAAGH